MENTTIKREKRTHFDFSKHELTIKKDSIGTIYSLRLPCGSINHSVDFINVNGYTFVTGDFSRWSFCMALEPKKGFFVDDIYWSGKIEIMSNQLTKEYSPERTGEKIEQVITEIEDEDYRSLDEDENEDALIYFEELLNEVDNTGDNYREIALEGLPSFLSYEDFYYETDIHYHLKAVFDAFERICDIIE